MKTVQAPSSPFSRRLGAALIALACVASASSAWAQWQWRDASGRRIFSDTPPPASVADKDILQRPKGATAAPSAQPSDTSAAPASAASPRPPAVDASLDEKKKVLEKAEADKKQAESKAIEAKNAKIRADNCESARRSKAALDSGLRITTTNAKGESEYLDDAGRAAQQRKLQDLIRENCR